MTPTLRLAPTLLALALAVSGCTGKYVRPTTADKIQPTPELVTRGSYLVNQVAMCTVCHRPRVGDNWLGGERTDAYLAGGARWHDLGFDFKIVAPNITPDPETGVGAWSDDELLRAIRDGVHRDGRLLMPPMPFGSYAVMSDDDARAIVAYLRTVPPVKNKVDREGWNDFPFMMGMAAKMGAMHHEPAKNVKAPPKTDKVAYGRYLGQLGLCYECHSLGKMGPDKDSELAGSTIAFWEKEYGKLYARNLTPDKETGLGKYTALQIKDAMKAGRRLDGKVMAPPMSGLIPHLSTWNEDDLDALVAYMMSVKPVKRTVPERSLSAEAKKQVGE